MIEILLLMARGFAYNYELPQRIRPVLIIIPLRLLENLGLAAHQFPTVVTNLCDAMRTARSVAEGPSTEVFGAVVQDAAAPERV